MKNYLWWFFKSKCFKYVSNYQQLKAQDQRIVEWGQTATIQTPENSESLTSCGKKRIGGRNAKENHSR